jgi:hypothetical protein
MNLKKKIKQRFIEKHTCFLFTHSNYILFVLYINVFYLPAKNTQQQQESTKKQKKKFFLIL